MKSNYSSREVRTGIRVSFIWGTLPTQLEELTKGFAWIVGLALRTIPVMHGHNGRHRLVMHNRANMHCLMKICQPNSHTTRGPIQVHFIKSQNADHCISSSDMTLIKAFNVKLSCAPLWNVSCNWHDFTTVQSDITAKTMCTTNVNLCGCQRSDLSVIQQKCLVYTRTPTSDINSKVQIVSMGITEIFMLLGM